MALLHAAAAGLLDAPVAAAAAAGDEATGGVSGLLRGLIEHIEASEPQLLGKVTSLPPMETCMEHDLRPI